MHENLESFGAGDEASVRGLHHRSSPAPTPAMHQHKNRVATRPGHIAPVADMCWSCEQAPATVNLNPPKVCSRCALDAIRLLEIPDWVRADA